jgi:hypothetical protein
MSQNSVVVYSQAIQSQLKSIAGVTPVYANFNRNWAKEDKFYTWNLRNVHQPVFTGQTQNNKGIDTPVFQLNVFAKNYTDAMNLTQTMIDALHGYSGQFGSSLTSVFFVSKIDVYMLYNTYDNEIGLQQVVLDCTLYIPT